MATERGIETLEEAEALLAELGAPQRLMTHGRLVLEAADELLAKIGALGIVLDERLVRAGAMLHDAGKILHAAELSGGGAQHEEAGQRLLLERGVDPAVARCCVTHAKWAEMTCSEEELLVALADALWKGARRHALEKCVIDRVADRLRVDAWAIFTDLDACFERIADRGSERLRRSI
jgi:hypothetical protein